MAERLIPYQCRRELNWNAYYPGALQVGGLMDMAQEALVRYPYMLAPEEIVQGSLILEGQSPIRIVITHDFARLQSEGPKRGIIGFDMCAGKKGGVTRFCTWVAHMPNPCSKETTLLASNNINAKTIGGQWE